MYRPTAFDQHFIRQRARQYRDQLERHLAGELPEEEFRPLRLQNGWYVQRHAPMLRVAVPYGELSSVQLRTLADIADDFDRVDFGPFAGQGGFGHFTTRQNLQFNWIPLDRSADVMDRLAEVGLHGIQTSGNCIRNITSDAFAGIARDEVVDPRPYCELLRQWSTLHPEFAFLPRKFKIAVSGALEDRAAIAWHDIGLRLHRNDAGDVGFEVRVGGGMGRTPIVGRVLSGFVPWEQILVYIEAVVRVYNRFGRRDNAYKARIKILVKSEGERFAEAVESEFRQILLRDDFGSAQLLTQQEFDRVAAGFVVPEGVVATPETSDDGAGLPAADAKPYTRWLSRNVHGHRIDGYRAVTLSLKRAGLPPGDATADQLRSAADLAERFSHGELRVTHEQNLVLPWVALRGLPELWAAAKAAGMASSNIGLISDLIACPGGDLCALANARTIPIAEALSERFADLDEQHDIGDIDLHISGCINSCGHHHSGHIGVLGVDKDGREWYQVTVGGSDGRLLSGGLDRASGGTVIGPAFSADELPDAVEAVVDAYRLLRTAREPFIDTVRRLGALPFRQAADAVRRAAADGHTTVDVEAATA